MEYVAGLCLGLCLGLVIAILLFLLFVRWREVDGLQSSNNIQAEVLREHIRAALEDTMYLNKRIVELENEVATRINTQIKQSDEINRLRRQIEGWTA